MDRLIEALRRSYTIGDMRRTLARFGLDAGSDVSSSMFSGSYEHCAAAALARSTIGA